MCTASCRVCRSVIRSTLTCVPHVYRSFAAVHERASSPTLPPGHNIFGDHDREALQPNTSGQTASGAGRIVAGELHVPELAGHTDRQSCIADPTI